MSEVIPADPVLLAAWVGVSPDERLPGLTSKILGFGKAEAEVKLEPIRVGLRLWRDRGAENPEFANWQNHKSWRIRSCFYAAVPTINLPESGVHVLTSLESGLQDPSKAVRHLVACRMGQFFELHPEIFERFANDDSPELKLVAAQNLGNLTDPEKHESKITDLCLSNSPEISAAALTNMLSFQTRHEKLFKTVLKSAASSHETSVRLNAANLVVAPLLAENFDRNFPLFRSWPKNSEASIRFTFISALGLSRPTASLLVYFKRALQDTEQVVREAALSQLARFVGWLPISEVEPLLVIAEADGAGKISTRAKILRARFESATALEAGEDGGEGDDEDDDDEAES